MSSDTIYPLSQQQVLDLLTGLEPLVLTPDGRCYQDSQGQRYRRITSVTKLPGDEFKDPEGRYAHTAPIGTEIHALFECQVTGDEQVAKETRTGMLSESIRSAIYDDFTGLIELLTQDGSVLLAETQYRCQWNLVAGRVDVTRVRPDGRHGILDFKSKSPNGYQYYASGYQGKPSTFQKWTGQLSGYTRLGESMGIGTASCRHIIPIVVVEADPVTHEVASWSRKPSIAIPYDRAFIDTLLPLPALPVTHPSYVRL